MGSTKKPTTKTAAQKGQLLPEASLYEEIRKKTNEIDPDTGLSSADIETSEFLHAHSHPYISADDAIHRILGETLYRFEELDDEFYPMDDGEYVKEYANAWKSAILDKAPPDEIERKKAEWESAQKAWKERCATINGFYEELSRVRSGKMRPDDVLCIALDHPDPQQIKLVKPSVAKWAHTKANKRILEWEVEGYSDKSIWLSADVAETLYLTIALLIDEICKLTSEATRGKKPNALDIANRVEAQAQQILPPDYLEGQGAENVRKHLARALATRTDKIRKHAGK